MSQPTPQPTPTSNPEPIFAQINTFQQTEAMKAALELELFTAVAEGNNTVESLAKCCQASQRGIRILCDYFVVRGFLTKNSSTYGLTPDASLFLNRHSPGYMGGSVN